MSTNIKQIDVLRQLEKIEAAFEGDEEGLEKEFTNFAIKHFDRISDYIDKRMNEKAPPYVIG